MFKPFKKFSRSPTEVRSEHEEFAAALKGNPVNSVNINKDNALNIPAVATAVEFITSTVASLPVKLYSRDRDVVTEVEDDYRLRLFNEDTGDLLDAVQFKKALITDMLLKGAGYAYINKKGNTIKSLHYLEEKNVSVIEGTDKIFKSVTIYVNGKPYPDFNILRITRATVNGVKGTGVLDQNPLLFNAMYNALKYENTAISSGTKRGFLKSARRLEKPMLDDLKSAWRKLYSTDNSPDVMVLNDGISFEPASSTATENQLNESKRTNSELVYNLFGLSAALFNGGTTNEIYINAIKTGILPIVTALNVALNKFVLLEKEKKNLFFAVDVSDLLKGSLEERYRGYEIALKNGWLQIDEIRKRENMKSLGLDFVKLGLADVLYDPATKAVYAVNTNATYTLGSGGKEGTE